MDKTYANIQLLYWNVIRDFLVVVVVGSAYS